MSATETLTRDELGQRLLAQNVAREHMAFRCWVCGTVQSLASFARAGVAPELAERQIGFSCVGRHTDAGAWIPGDLRRMAVPGCNWTLGGFLGGGILIVDGDHTRRAFEPATPDEARDLRDREGEILPALPRPRRPRDISSHPELPADIREQPAGEGGAR